MASNLDKLLELIDKLEDPLKINTVLENVTDGWWDLYLDKDYEYYSPKFWETLGYDPKTKTNSPEEWKKIIHPDDLEDAALTNLQKHISTKGKEPYYQLVRYKNGKTNKYDKFIICRGQVVEWNKDGSPKRMVGVHIDVSEIWSQD